MVIDIICAAAAAVARQHRIRHLPIPANQPDVTQSSWIEVTYNSLHVPKPSCYWNCRLEDNSTYDCIIQHDYFSDIVSCLGPL